MYTIREIGENIKNCENFRGNVLFGVPMSARTTMKVGGNAELIIEPEDENALSAALGVIQTMNSDFFVLGGGSNLVVSDGGVKQPVISLRNFSGISILEIDGEFFLECGAGATWGSIFNFCSEKNFSGLLKFTGLPGTVGGAVFMNASCFGSSVSDVIQSAKYMSANGQSQVYAVNEADWGYKKSPFQTGGADKKIVTSAIFRVQKSTENVREKGLSFLAKRREMGHFEKPCAGSVFKNPAGEKSAGRLIDECGLKGFKIGGAQVSLKHANIIVNSGNATQKDISALVDFVAAEVLRKKNVQFSAEIVFW